jgi:hypothetical protein
MAHFLDNDWSVFVITFPGGVPRITADGTLHLRHASNQLDNTSTHGGNMLTGSSTPDGGGFEIRFSEAVSGGGTTKFRGYTGSLMDHKIISGVEQKVIGGFRGRLLDLKALEEDIEAKLFAGQNDGIWIATQP